MLLMSEPLPPGYAVLMTCPRRGLPIPIGVMTDPESFESMTFIDTHVRCPLCGAMHAFWKEPGGDSNVFLSDKPITE
jgi:hypothetical protein